jgi:hypothetical protein
MLPLRAHEQPANQPEKMKRSASCPLGGAVILSPTRLIRADDVELKERAARVLSPGKPMDLPVDLIVGDNERVVHSISRLLTGRSLTKQPRPGGHALRLTVEGARDER